MTVKEAEKTIATLQQKREQCIRQGTELHDERANVALAAHTGDSKARECLDDINAQVATHASELASLDEALRVATQRLERAHKHEAAHADREAAKRMIDRFRQFVALAQTLDAALARVVETSSAMGATLNEIHALGRAAPTGQQWLTYGEMAMQSALMQTPWARSFRHLAPRERRNFSDLAQSWASSAQRDATARFGEEEAA